MTSFAEPRFDHEEISRKLIAAGLIKSRSKIVLTAYTPIYVRRTPARRWHYRVSSGDRNICHLILGLELAGLYARAQGIFEACPELICQPLLYWEDAERMGFLCVDHFDGDSLDALVSSERITARAWMEKVTRAENMLRETARPSTIAALQEEVALLITEIVSTPGFTPFDAKLLRELVAPILANAAGGEPISAQWTNGDFTGANLLVNGRDEMRLIDYEYAQITHFRSVDWLRLKNFSVLPPGLDLPSFPQFREALGPTSEMHFWISHLAHLKNAELDEETKAHVSEVISGIFRALVQATSARMTPGESSLLLRFLSDRESQSDALVKQRTDWASSLEAELQTARAANDQKTVELVERTSWARSLETDLTVARTTLDEQNKKLDERTSWAKSLETDFQKSQCQLAETQQRLLQLDKEYAAQNQWAVSLEKNLANERQLFRNLTEEHAQRTQWAHSLSSELASAKANFAELTLAHEKRTAWAAALQEDLKLHADRIAELTALNNAFVEELEKVQVEKLEILREKKQAEYATLVVQRELLEKDAEFRQALARAIQGETRVKALQSTAQKLDRSLEDAQQHIDHLLTQIEAVRRSAAAEQQKANSTQQAFEAEISKLSERSGRLRAELDRYESSTLCRWLARSSRKTSSSAETE